MSVYIIYAYLCRININVLKNFLILSSTMYTDLLPEIQSESHVPDIAILVVKSMEDGHSAVTKSQGVVHVCQGAGLPTNYTILTRLQNNQQQKSVNAQSIRLQNYQCYQKQTNYQTSTYIYTTTNSKT